MAGDSPNHPQTVAISQLEALGLSSYAARTYVALVSLGDGTAQEVSRVVDVPRTRVYDAVEELHERGLVDVQHSTPKRFWATPTESAARQFHEEYTSRIDRLSAALDGLESTVRPTEQHGVWTVSGQTAVTNRVIEGFDAATDEIVYMTVDDLLDDALIERLRAADDRGVDIKLAGMESEVEDRLTTALPEVELFESMWAWSDTPAGRVLMVDERETLASVFVPDVDERLPTRTRETAIWGAGETNSLVILLKAMFTWQLGGDRTSSESSQQV